MVGKGSEASGRVQMNLKLEKHYDDYYSGGHSEWRTLGAISKANNIIKLCGTGNYDRVAEVGCGDGSILAELSNMDFADSLSGMEVSRTGINVLKQRNIKNLERAILFDGYSIPCEDDEYDLVILSHVIEHVEHPRILLKEVMRITKSSGAILVEVPLELRLRTPRDFIWTNTGHINLYNPTTIRWLLQSLDLNVVEEIITNSSYDVHKRLYGRQAWGRYLIREAMLRSAPNLATKLLTYNWTALCHPPPSS